MLTLILLFLQMMNRTKFFILLFFILFCFESKAGVPIYINPDDGTPIIWDITAPIPYYIDPDILGKLTQEQATQLIQYAIQIWEDTSNTSIQFEFKEYLELDVNKETYESVYNKFEDYKEGERAVYIIFDNDGTFDEEIWNSSPNSVAVTIPDGIPYYWDEENPSINYQKMLLIVNGKRIDGIKEAGKVESSVLQMTGTLVHELGHVLGLYHTENNFSDYNFIYGYDDDFIYTSTMNGLTGIDEKGYTINLNPDDLATISWFYPNETSISELGEIYGTVLLPDTTLYSKLQVIARNINDPLCESFVTYTGYYCTPKQTSSGYLSYKGDYCGDSTQEGNFEFHHLPPGNYVIEVNEVFEYYSSALSPYSSPPEIPGGAELWNEDDAADEDPYLYSTITVEAGETVEGINIVLRSSEVNSDDEVYLERIPYDFYEENGMPSLPEEESRCKSNTIDYAALIGVDESSGSSSGETTGSEQDVNSSSGGGGCSFSMKI